MLFRSPRDASSASAASTASQRKNRRWKRSNKSLRIKGPRLGGGFSFYNLSVTDIGKTLVFIGVLLAAAGVVVLLLGRTNLPLGRLPGDIVYRGKHTTFYFPLATSIVVSVVLSLVFYILGRIKR